MRHVLFSLVVIAVLVVIVPVSGRMALSGLTDGWTSPVVVRPPRDGFAGEPLERSSDERGLEVTMTPPPWTRQGVDLAPDRNLGFTTLADPMLLQQVKKVRPGLSASNWQPSLIAADPPAPQEQPNYRVAGVFTYKFKNAPVAPAPGNANYTGPDSGAPSTHEVSLELGITWAASPKAVLFADLNTKYASDVGFTTISIERLHLTVADSLGIRDLKSRIGRDGIRLGVEGLLLDEVLHDDDRRDGVELWLSPARAVNVYGFVQYALDDRTTSRRVWGGRADSDFNGWTLGLNYRADTASAVDAGTCPGITCNTGSGFGVDGEGSIRPGVGLTFAYARYTQTGDVPRNYDRVDLVFDLDQLRGPQALHPVVTLWYKNFDPYTIPGADGTAPRGGFVTPDDFKLFSVNDNLAALGSRVDLQLTNDLALLARGEWGTYKGGGPTFNVYSVGLRYGFPQNNIVKLSYNAYAVAGGSVTTSPASGIVLSNATVYQLEFTKSW